MKRESPSADSLADRLRREAEHVTRKAEWLTQLQQHRDQLARLDQNSGDRGLPARPVA